MILFYADTRHASATSDDPVTTGSVGIPVTVTLTPDYTGLNATLVFENGTTYADVPLLGQDVTVPSDVCLKTGKLRMGVYASDQSGEVVIPTIWADVSPVVVGVRPSGIDPAPPAPSWADLVMEAARKAGEDAEAARADADSARADADSAREDAEAAKSDAERALAVSNDVEMLEDVSVSLTPFFARKPPYGGAYYDDYWNSYSTRYLTDLDGGWAHWHEELTGDQDGRRWSHEFISVAKSGDLRPGGVYTFILEVRNFVCVAGDESEPPNIFFGYGSGGSGANTQVYDPKQVPYPISHDGKYVIPLVGSLVQDKPDLIHVGASSIAGSVFDCDIRMSLYSGMHVGGYIANPTNTEDTLSLTGKTADEAHAVNLTPMFSAYDDDSYWNSISAKYSDEPHPRNGWIGLHITGDDNNRQVIDAALGKLDWIVPGAPYTLLIDVVGLDESSTEATLGVHTSRSQLYQRSTGYATVTTMITDGSYRFFMSARDNPHTSFLTCATAFSIVVPSGVEATLAVRASLYDGDYTGEYKPCLSWINGEVEGLSEAVNSLDETVGDVSEAIGGINENVATITEELSEVSGSIRHLGDNLTPFFSRQPTGESPDPYWYWHHTWASTEYLGGGWMRAECDNDSTATVGMYTYVPRRIEGLRAGARYTLLVEVRNLDHGAIDGGEHEPSDRNPFIQVGYNGYDYQLNVASYAKQEQPITGDGRYLYEVYAADNIASSSRDKLVKCNVFAPPYQHVSVEVRISLWEGDYDGPWKPCPWWLSDEVESISGNISDISEEISEIKEDISSIGGVKNLTPFFSCEVKDNIEQYWIDVPEYIYHPEWDTVREWNNFEWHTYSDDPDSFTQYSLAPCPHTITQGGTYTLLVEVANYETEGVDAALLVRSDYSAQLEASAEPNDDNGYKITLTGNGKYRVQLATVEFEEGDYPYRLIALCLLIPDSCHGSMDVRMSLYDGDYQGDYVPFWDISWLDREVAALDGAVSTADNARIIAESAQTTAGTAKSTANEAKSLATTRNIDPMLMYLGDDGHWSTTDGFSYLTKLEDGWAHVNVDNREGFEDVSIHIAPVTSSFVTGDDKSYTLLVETKDQTFWKYGHNDAKVGINLFKKSHSPMQQVYVQSTGITHYDVPEGSPWKFSKKFYWIKSERSSQDNPIVLTDIELVIPAYWHVEFDLRLSLFDEGAYPGSYVPYFHWVEEAMSGLGQSMSETKTNVSNLLERIDVSSGVTLNPDSQIPVNDLDVTAIRVGDIVHLNVLARLSDSYTLNGDAELLVLSGDATPNEVLDGLMLTNISRTMATLIHAVEVSDGLNGFVMLSSSHDVGVTATGTDVYMSDVELGSTDVIQISGSYLAHVEEDGS